MSRVVIEHSVRQLVDNFGFDEQKSRQAVAAIGDKSDIQMAYNWLLDHGEEDKGGPVEPKHCPHLDILHTRLVVPQNLRLDQPCAQGCTSGENWICLICGQTRCSRYVKSHSKEHHLATRAEEEKTLTVAEASRGVSALGHFVALSLGDLSVWCYECDSYIRHPSAIALSKEVERIKFGTVSASAASTSSTRTAQVGDPLVGSLEELHGSRGDLSWAPPKIVRACEMEARPNYKTCLAHEYLDEPSVLDAKVKLLANLLLQSKNCVAYTGAGLSTASGISDYATKASDSIAHTKTTPKAKVSPLDAQPTLAHHVLVGLHKQKGVLKHWIQQNHDGLPQKAGFPQEHMNEIHGGWFDPSNPVVPMSGTLRDDLMSDLVEWEEKTDLCLALGSSLCGMNADRMAVTPAKKALKKKGNSLGTVIVSIQCTQYDNISQLRIFATIDDVMSKLAHELAIAMPSREVPFSLTYANIPAHELKSCLFTNLPYDEKGKLSRTKRQTLDLRLGTNLKIVNQPSWDLERSAAIASVSGRANDGHIKIVVGGFGRLFGLWWIDAAKAGKIPYIPVVNTICDFTS